MQSLFSALTIALLLAATVQTQYTLAFSGPLSLDVWIVRLLLFAAGLLAGIALSTTLGGPATPGEFVALYAAVHLPAVVALLLRWRRG